MFRTERQQAAVSEALCRCVRLAGMWTPDGPTKRALSFLERRGALSHGEQLMLQASFDVWNGRGHMDLGEALGTLDGRNLRALGSLLIAIAAGADAVDRWLAEWTPSGPAPTAP